MQTSMLATGTTPHAVVPRSSFRATVVRHANRMRDAIRFARSRATDKQREEYARTVAKKCLSSDRSKAIEYVVTLVIDAAQRGSPDAEAIGLHLAAIARAENPYTDPVLSVSEAKLLEQLTQGEMENAEKALDLFPTMTNRLRLLASSAKYQEAVRVRDEAVRRELVAEEN